MFDCVSFRYRLDTPLVSAVGRGLWVKWDIRPNPLRDNLGDSLWGVVKRTWMGR